MDANDDTTPTGEDVRRLLRHWGALWDVDELDRVLVRTSSRMFTTLGNYRPHRDEIRLASHLYEVGGPDLWQEVLCHEAAHAAVWRKHGRSVAAHGPEWKGLMKAAGYSSRATLPTTPELADYIRQRRQARPPRRRRRRVKVSLPRLLRWMTAE